jgi:hypothetical protein
MIFQACQAQQSEVVLKNEKGDYPQNYFRKPLDIPLYLSGTFGELRNNHFHAGLDFKTQQKEGFEVYAAAEGYISRIKISNWGYGKAIYITHPKGYTTVYAHLKKFNPTIEKYLKKRQYEKESFEIQLFPKKNELPIPTNKIIGYSGSTGGFAGPHLHFEIRDTKTAMPINPMQFGYAIEDSQKPIIKSLYAFPQNKESHANGLGMKHLLNTFASKNGVLKTNTINAFGQISLGVAAYDLLDGATNKNGLYKLKMFVNGEKAHEFKAETFSYNESKLINLLIDYEIYKTKNQRIQKCYIEDHNDLSMYNRTLNGVINIENGKRYEVLIVAEDFAGNVQRVNIPIEGVKTSKIITEKEFETNYKIDHKQPKQFSNGNVSLSFPANAFYEDLYLKFEASDSIAEVHTPTIPLRKKYKLSFNTSKYSQEAKKQLYIAYKKPGSERAYFRETSRTENSISAEVKELGTYILIKDLYPPKASVVNIKEEQWASNHQHLKVKIEDKESGIKSYIGTINGKWILMEYDLKKGILIYDFNDLNFNQAKHEFKLILKDKVGNQTILKRTFYRK